MTAPSKSRTHLVERAFQAMGGAAAAAPRPPLGEGVDPAGAALAPHPDAAVPPKPVPPMPPAGPVAAMTATLAEPIRGGAAQPASGVVERPNVAPAQDGDLASLPPRQSAPSGRTTVTPPSFEVMRRAGLVLATGSATRTRLAEEFSVVHHQLLRTIRTMDPPAEGSGRGRRVVLVTSARPGEGKSFCSLNIAVSIASGRSAPVLLVDADGKRGSITELLGVTEAPGLRLLATDPAQPPAPLLIPTEQRNLSFLPYGAPVAGAPPVPPGTTVAAAVQRLAALLPQHVIILDTPPCLSTSDPSSLAPVAGQVLLVVEAEKTQRAEVESALDMVEACPVLQLMLNQARQNSSDTFGAYGAYGGYGVYGSYGPKPDSSG